MDYITCIGLYFQSVIVYCVGDPTVYENIIWQSGDPLPSQAQLDAMLLQHNQTFFTTGMMDLVQKRLDAFAATRGYGNLDKTNALVSAITYLTSTNPQRAMEAAYCVKIRDDTWNAYFTLEETVNAGMETLPTSFEEVELFLPKYTWPSLTTTVNSTT